MVKKSITGQGPEVIEKFVQTMDECKKNGNPIFIKLYANWCGHCKSMQPAWNDLSSGKDDDDLKDVNFLEIEADAINALNTSKDNKTGAYKHLLKVDGGYPTIFLVDLNTNKRAEYKSNARTKVDMKNFIKSEKGKKSGGGRKRRRTTTKRRRTTKKRRRTTRRTYI